MEQEYIYAVARIKARELSLLTQQDLDRLMACKTPAECFRALADKGWGAGGETSAEAIFAAEEEKTWALMHELLPDLTPFSVLLYPIDFNNMKAAVKCTVTNAEPHNVFMSGSTVEPEKMQQAVRENDFSLLPDFMAEAAKKATDALLTTRDGQRCDIILDRACLTAIHKAGKESKNALITAFSEFKVAAADIKSRHALCTPAKAVRFWKKASPRATRWIWKSSLTRRRKTRTRFTRTFPVRTMLTA